MNSKTEIDELQAAKPSDSASYSVAFVNGADGSWDCVHSFVADGIDAANEAAAAWVAVHHPGRINDWYVVSIGGGAVDAPPPPREAEGG